MRNIYLLDTNILIYFFNGITDDEKIFDIFQNDFNISIITKIEFLSWQKLYNNKDLSEKASMFTSHAMVYDLDDMVANQAIKYRQSLKMKIPDAIIGATAMVHGFEVVTNNISDFKNMGLNICAVKLR